MKILVIGCGSIGKRHSLNASKIAETAIFDENHDDAKEYANTIDAHTFSTLDDGLDWKPDGAVIATPTDSHISIAQKVIERGIDVLIEKPISHNLKNIDKLLKDAGKNNSKVFVVCNMRYHPGVATIWKNLKKIGTPLFARAHFGNLISNMRPGLDYKKLYCSSKNRGGGVVLDSIHEIDYLMWFFGRVNKIVSHKNKISRLEIDTEDYASLIMEHDNGIVSEIHLDYLRPFKRRGCEVVGDKGMLLWQSEGKNPEYCKIQLFDKTANHWVTLFSTHDLEPNKPYIELMQQFINAIQEKPTKLLKGHEAKDELVVALKALGTYDRM